MRISAQRSLVKRAWANTSESEANAHVNFMYTN
jgi:hypothetical protein